MSNKVQNWLQKSGSYDIDIKTVLTIVQEPLKIHYFLLELLKLKSFFNSICIKKVDKITFYKK